MNKKQWVTLCFVLFAINLFSQTEEFFILGQNDSIINSREQQSRLKSNSFVLPYSSLLHLPFFDDFARPGIFPYKGYWADENVYINNTFCKLPPSIFVATFDALGSNGLLHKNASSSVFAADTLTSQPFDLENHDVFVVSTNLYTKSNLGIYTKISENHFYKSNNSFVLLLSSPYNYYPSDTIFEKVNDLFIPIKDSIYTKTAAGFKYIEDSYNHKKTTSAYVMSDSLYLSFDIQAGGIGDMPESSDSLLLEAFAPTKTNKLLINEVDSAWIELFNGTDTITDVAGKYLFSNTIAKIKTRIDTSKGKIYWKNFQIPNDGSIETRIPPKGLLTINLSDLDTNIKLTSAIIMLCSDTVSKDIIDSVYISNTDSRTNKTFGRLSDGDGFDGDNALAFVTKNSFNSQWTQLWSISADSLLPDSFYRISIPINKPLLQKGFRFRFINYASLSSDKSHARNEDQWNLDNISLIANQIKGYEEADSRLRSVDAKLYGAYTSIPIEHIMNIDENEIHSFLNFKVQSTDTLYRFNGYTTDFWNKKAAKSKKITNDWGNMNPIPQRTTTLPLPLVEKYNFYDIFQQSTSNYADYEFDMYYSDDKSDVHKEYRWNDTVRIHQSFYNYYSYDDGSSEAGWGIRGVENAQIAYKFQTYQYDTLNAVEFYFNNTLNTTDFTFNLCVWADNKGIPGTLLAQKSVQSIKFDEGINHFVLYPLDSSCIIEKELFKDLILKQKQTFYIGWIQPTDILMNVGVDLNDTVSNSLFFKAGLNWQKSLMINPLMIRPVFDTNPFVVSLPTLAKEFANLYPNPAKDFCNITLNDNSDISDYTLSIKTTIGQEIIHEQATSQFSTTELTNGMYYINLTNSKGKSYSTKLIINR